LAAAGYGPLSAPARSPQCRRSGLSFPFDLRCERLPCIRAESEAGTVLVVAVPDEHRVGGGRHFRAVAAVIAKAGLPPAQIYCFHCSSATSMMRSRDWAHGSASLRIRSKVTAARRTSDLDSAVCPSGTASVCSTSGPPSPLARLMSPDSPACAPTLDGTTCTLMFGRVARSARWVN